VLPFDAAAARHHADLAVKARAAGRGFPTPDGYIAAIADAHGFTVASRDPVAFRAAGLTVIDPWRGAV
jgi:predicted nucleic acid-binding protein